MRNSAFGVVKRVTMLVIVVLLLLGENLVRVREKPGRVKCEWP